MLDLLNSSSFCSSGEVLEYGLDTYDAGNGNDITRNAYLETIGMARHTIATFIYPKRKNNMHGACGTQNSIPR